MGVPSLPVSFHHTILVGADKWPCFLFPHSVTHPARTITQSSERKKEKKIERKKEKKKEIQMLF
jgi:hypothetical protein